MNLFKEIWGFVSLIGGLAIIGWILSKVAT